LIKEVNIMYVFYGEKEVIDKTKEAVEKRAVDEIRCFTYQKGKEKNLLDFVKKNEHKIEIIAYLTLNEKELIYLSEEVNNISSDIYQIALVNDTKDMEKDHALKGVVKKDQEILNTLFKKIDTHILKNKSEKLKKAVCSTQGNIAIFIHDNPDPDAIASAVAFEEICDAEKIESTIFFGGSIGHPANEIFLENTGFDVKNIDEDSVSKIVDEYQKIVFIDFAQPGSNNILPKNMEPDIVIDHHYTNKECGAKEFQEIRNDVGATSTLMTKHLQNLEISISPLLASALLVGIKTDTHDYTKNISTADYKAISYLSSLADKDILDILKEPSLYPETMKSMGIAINNRKIEDTVLTAFSGELDHRDDLPQIADFLLRERDILTVLVYGIIDDKIHMSARSKDLLTHVGKVMKNAYSDIGEGGGHTHAAGGRVPLDEFKDKKDAIEKIEKRFKDEVFKK